MAMKYSHALKLNPCCNLLRSTQYNTALIRGSIHNILGGGVDKGGNVRAESKELIDLLNDTNIIRELRRKVRSDEERSDELRMPSLATKIACSNSHP